MRTPVLLGTLALALAISLAMYSQRGTQDVNSQPTSVPSPSDMRPSPAALASEDRLEVETAPPPPDETTVETEMVEGISVRKDRNCTVKVHYLETSPGITTKAYSCEPNEVVRHPYDDYSDAVLVELSYSDAEAARILGIRKRDNHKEALQYFARAAALNNGDPAPILYYSNLYPHPTVVNGVPVKQTIHTKLVLATVAERLGANDTALQYWESQARLAFDDPQEAIADAQSGADEVLMYMRNIQLTVSGHTSIGE